MPRDLVLNLFVVGVGVTILKFGKGVIVATNE